MDSHSILPMCAKPSTVWPAFTTMRARLSETTLRMLLEKRLWLRLYTATSIIPLLGSPS